MPLTYAYSRLRYALKQLADGDLLRDRRLTLRDAFLYLWLASKYGRRGADVLVTQGQGVLAAQSGMSEPSVAAALESLASAGHLVDMRLNSQSVKEFVIPKGESVDDPSPGRRSIVAKEVLEGAGGAGLRKGEKVALVLLLYLSNGGGLVAGRSDREIASLLGVQTEKLMHLLAELQSKGFLVLKKEAVRGGIDGIRMIIELALNRLISLGWCNHEEVVRVRVYSPDGCEGPAEGISKYIKAIGSLNSNADNIASNNVYSFGKKYLIDPPHLWPDAVDLYFLEKGDGWAMKYSDTYMHPPEDVVEKINEFTASLLDKLFLSLALQIVEEYQDSILSPNDDVFKYASDLVRNHLAKVYLKRGFRDEENSWVVSEVAVCLIRQAQRVRLILAHAIGWQEFDTKYSLECARASYAGKLNCYEVAYIVKHNSSDPFAGIKDFDMEAYDTSVVKYES